VLPVATTSSGRSSVPNQRVHPLQVVLRRNLLLILSQFIIPHNSISLPLLVFSLEALFFVFEQMFFGQSHGLQI